MKTAVSVPDEVFDEAEAAAALAALDPRLSLRSTRAA